MRVIRSVEVEGERKDEVAETPRGSEEELARGRVEQTPFTMINWLAVAIGAVVALVVGVVVVAYLVA